MGHQLVFAKSTKTRFNHGGVLRNLQCGRGFRPLNTKDPHHIVYKVDRQILRERSLRGYRSFALSQKIIHKYAFRFFVKIEQISIQGDHIHILIRCSRRSQFLNFFRVTTGQIAQIFQKKGLLRKVMTDTPKILKRRGTKLWKQRPFSRIVRGWKSYEIVRNYIQLNEKEALGEIKYNKLRLRGLSSGEWKILWS